MNESDLGNYYEILRCCDEVLDKVEHYGLDENSWAYNQYDRDSVLMTLGQVGESASHFKTNDYLALFPEIEWKRMKGMRNFIYHVYRRVDVYLTWNVICSDIPHLRNALLENAEMPQASKTPRSDRHYDRPRRLSSKRDTHRQRRHPALNRVSRGTLGSSGRICEIVEH